MAQAASPGICPVAQGETHFPCPHHPSAEIQTLMGMGEMSDGRLMLGWQSKPGMGITPAPGEHGVLVEMESLQRITHHCTATLKEQRPCSPKSALVRGTLVQKAWLAKAERAQ